jgi:hypothetical protein
MVFRLFSLVCFFCIALNVNADETSPLDLKKEELICTVLQILDEQPDSIEEWLEDKVYLNPERIYLTRQGAFCCKKRSVIPLPSFEFDGNGIFISCSQQDIIRQTQAQYGKIFDTLRHALGNLNSIEQEIHFPEVPSFEEEPLEKEK